MKGNMWLSSLSVLALLGVTEMVGCGNTPADEPTVSEEGAAKAALAACGLDDGTIDVRDALTDTWRKPHEHSRTDVFFFSGCAGHDDGFGDARVQQ